LDPVSELGQLLGLQITVVIGAFCAQKNIVVLVVFVVALKNILKLELIIQFFELLRGH
jgi:hypothetical protein